MGGSTCAALVGSAEPSWQAPGIRQVASAFRASPRSRWQEVAPEEDTVFTGIVEELGEVVDLELTGGSARLRVRGPRVTEDAARGDSIAINGVCPTVTQGGGGKLPALGIAATPDRAGRGALTAGLASHPLDPT